MLQMCRHGAAHTCRTPAGNRDRGRGMPEDHQNQLSGAPAAVQDEGEKAERDSQLEAAIGRQVRQYRKQLDLKVSDLSRMSGVSAAMLSKIENGTTSPSLATIQAVAEALNVPVTSLFRKFDIQRDAVHVRAGNGLVIERGGTRAGHEYRLLGHALDKRVNVEPYLVTLTESSEVFPLFQHEGIEFIYLLEGEMIYRYGGSTYHLQEGDSLFFDSDVTHGPDELIRLPIRMLSVQARQAE